MKSFSLFAGAVLSAVLSAVSAPCVFAAGNDHDYPIHPVPFTSVKLTDDFWAPRIRRNQEVTIPIALKQCYETGRVDNFLRAAHEKPGPFGTEFPFDDTDIYKIIEGASYSLQMTPDPQLEAKVDELIAIIAKAQEPDGYLYTARTIDPEHPHKWSGTKRWEKESELSHELYNSGHLFEAAAAHWQATGKRTFLDIALKNADLLCRDFGPGKLGRAPGHQIVEMGLARLYRITGKREYLELARFFLEQRGHGRDYSQDQIPVRNQREAVGHSVRATYMYSGMADVAALLGDAEYLTAIDAIWKDVVDRKLYATGGIGAVGAYEGFGGPYDLPNLAAYNETCAAIGNVYWNQRLFLLHGSSQYFDVLERTLYNGLISGVSLSGDHFFYPNPLESRGNHERSEWFGCACCPSNLCRFIPSVSGYVYATRGDRLYVNLYAESAAKVPLASGEIALEQRTRYPWNGDIELTVGTPVDAEFELALRIPGWARNQPVPGDLYCFADTTDEAVELSINGQDAPMKLEDGYAIVRRRWAKGDKVLLRLPMPVRRLTASDKVSADRGRVAFQRGPLVFAAEQPDNPGVNLRTAVVEPGARVETHFAPQLLDGVQVITASAKVLSRSEAGEISTQPATLTAIPYYAWANRGAALMEVWLGGSAAAIQVPNSSLAARSKVSASKPSPALVALNDQDEPKSSNDRGSANFHWPKGGATEWAQYDFPATSTVSKVRVYWWDDAPWGEGHVPQSARVLFRTKEGRWQEVSSPSPLGVSKDTYNETAFEPVSTAALRIEVTPSPNKAAGILEWSVE